MTKNAETIFDFTKLMADYSQLPGVDVEALVEGQRKTVAAFDAANRAAFEGVQKVVRRQVEMVQESLGGISPALGKLAASATPAAAAAKQAGLYKDAYEKAAADGRELIDLVTKSSRAATAPIQKRVVESLDEIKTQADKFAA
ncbi:MAG: TIGR01841 family phasin [Rhodospirillales bacterium]|jgi:phasin family protein|nr:TIGR01841 family phasin [Rhodospirillales bacterium]MDP6883351.1 TIGR01841 family phasin [Rhodospirillales bacterium]